MELRVLMKCFCDNEKNKATATSILLHFKLCVLNSYAIIVFKKKRTKRCEFVNKDHPGYFAKKRTIFGASFVTSLRPVVNER